MRLRGVLLLAPCLLLLAAPTRPQARQAVPYRDAGLEVDARVRDLLGRMTLDEKFWQLFMIPGDLDDPANDYSHGIFGLQISAPKGGGARAHAERINAIQRFFVEHTRLGIPIIPFDEAVHGLKQEGATVYPQSIALAATWDPPLVGHVAAAIASEAGNRGIRQVLSPVVNIADDVRWGRVEETYGEDPYLVSIMGRAFIEAFEHAGMVATPKHFVANVGEGGRDSYPIDRSERALAERFFPPFESAVRQAHARSIMTAYNSIDGSPATQNRRLLTDTLKREWGFQGFVISDAAATGGATVLHMTEASSDTATKDAFDAGLDVIFQSSFDQYRPYLDAFRRGLVADAVVSAAVARVLRVKFDLGLFEHPYVDVDRAASSNGSADHRALARDAARRAIVLLKNDRHVLPIAKTVQSIAVIGADAVEARLGGYSGPGVANVSILDGIRQKFGAFATVRHAPGPGRMTPGFIVVPSGSLSSKSDGRMVRGLAGEYFDNNRLDGAPRLVRTDPQVDFRWTLNSPGPGIPFDWYSVRWTGSLHVPASGAHQIGIEGNDGYRLYVDGRLAIDNWKKQSYGVRVVELVLEADTDHGIRLEYFESTGNARLKLVWDAGVVDGSQAQIDTAVSLVRQSDIAVVAVGLEEGEFRDRAILSLPGRQEDLILQLAATGKPVVVVAIGGSAFTMSRWLDRVDAVVDAWYPGEEGGDAVADVLVGDYNPGGRLPITFPVAEGQLPLYYNHKPTGRGDDYLDLTGQPLFPFGFGLSYTSFEYGDLRIEPAEIRASQPAVARCRVKNTGTRGGDEVVQLYIRDVLASVARPVMELKGFERVHLEPGEARDVAFTIDPGQLRMLDVNMRWVTEPGTFRVMIGGSSKDIRLRGAFLLR